MLGPDGLYGHIRANRWRSAYLLAGFVVLVALFWIAWCVLYAAVIDHWLLPKRRRYDPTVWEVLATGLHYAERRWWVPFVAAAAWFAIAYLMHADMIRLATGARGVERREAKHLYNRIETLAIAAGLPMPAVQIMPTSALNAYAAGLTPDRSVVAVTQGLLDTLAPDELDAVIAHELAHIKHRDVQLMTVATCFAGGLTLVGSAILSWRASQRSDDATDLIFTRRSRARSGPPVAVAVAIALAVATLALTHLFALMIKYALSRSREFLADAGAIELTKNPDALIRALHKISGHDHIPGLAPGIAAMMISSVTDQLFATHPPIDDRVRALVRHGGGRLAPPSSRPTRVVNTLAKAAPAIPALAATAPAVTPKRPARLLTPRPTTAATASASFLPPPPRRRRNFLNPPELSAT